MKFVPTLSDIEQAQKLIKPYIHETPILQSSAINKLLGAELFFKCENFQKTGSFKFRGACNSVFSLSSEEAKNGVATHSSGNHAQALALAAKMKNIAAYIVVPDNAPQIKKIAIEGYGAKVTYCQPTLQARESTLNEIVKQTQAVFVHPYDYFNVIAGQGTAAVEIFQKLQNIDVMMTPIGGGGLMSGTSIATKALSPKTVLVGSEPQNADDAFRSLQAQKLIPSQNPKTIADGLLTSLSERTFHILQQNIDNIFCASEENIIKAMRLIWERMKIVIEPSSAVPLAAIIQNPEFFKNKRIAIILSGGNVDLNNLSFFAQS